MKTSDNRNNDECDISHREFTEMREELCEDKNPIRTDLTLVSWEKPSSRVQKYILILFLIGPIYQLTWFMSNSEHLIWRRGLILHPRNTIKLIADSAALVPLLNVFQVYQPVIVAPIKNYKIDSAVSSHRGTDREINVSQNCQVRLMEYSFGNSYGKPFVADYTPPSCNFNHVIMNFTATSQGRQFDRLAIMYLGDIEVWRTSTAEPTRSGIYFEYTKDMSAYLSLWKSPQKLLFDLGNLVDEKYTGLINTTLTVTFSKTSSLTEHASQIIPVSSRKSSLNTSSVFQLPLDKATNTVTIPRSVKRAIFSVSACGQGDEEFWWSNVLQSHTQTFSKRNLTLFGYSPFREVQVLIDDQLAGVHWPFPVIFTGGIIPGLWHPIVGIDTYDLREHEIDITPWLGVLSDGSPHKFEIRVVGIQDHNNLNATLSEFVGSNWLVTGKIFLWQDAQETAITTGNPPEIRITDPMIRTSSSLSQNAMGQNETLDYMVNVTRSLSISSTINTAQGSRQVSWVQDISTINYGQFEAQGDFQITGQSTTGFDKSFGDVNYKMDYSYPLWTSTYGTSNELGDFVIKAEITRGLSIKVEGTSVFPSGIEPFFQDLDDSQTYGDYPVSRLETIQNCTGYYSSSQSAEESVSYGDTAQEFNFFGSRHGPQLLELYHRNVGATNGTLTYDQERILGREIDRSSVSALEKDINMVIYLENHRKRLGRFQSV
ncbi:Peptide-N4-asparagine amidase A [Golovinomyces cichoracearum]|uniref:Peptide-N4-asparagine amidase A n=1 Tax=Golovinomyces cichoracearum TaxID=62708 RepID=A0A420IAE0_9PEZI|nr:Peptide-N4-asparagine amidase A [Golovinomyces cichoracearum]